MKHHRRLLGAAVLLAVGAALAGARAAVDTLPTLDEFREHVRATPLVHVVTAARVKRLVASEDVVVVDAVEGDRLLAPCPVYSLPQGDTDHLLVTYWSVLTDREVLVVADDQLTARTIAAVLAEAGVARRVTVLRGGPEAWKRAGLAVVRTAESPALDVLSDVR